MEAFAPHLRRGAAPYARPIGRPMHHLELVELDSEPTVDADVVGCLAEAGTEAG